MEWIVSYVQNKNDKKSRKTFFCHKKVISDNIQFNNTREIIILFSKKEKQKYFAKYVFYLSKFCTSQ